MNLYVRKEDGKEKRVLRMHFSFLSFERYGGSFYGIIYTFAIATKIDKNNALFHVLKNNLDTITKHYKYYTFFLVFNFFNFFFCKMIFIIV
jgi:hypothetical protein